ncbi:MAG: GMC family oxidoreductase [Steroidobacteraceae bacterium]|jgi:choline dehydrogenase
MPMSDSDIFDYVIVGAGSAGCVLANRLSADPRRRVALLEAGGRADSFFVRMPIGYGKIAFEGGLSWHYSSAPEPGLDGRRVLLPRGKGLGGSSNINGLIYIRGQAADYDDWVGAGASGWGWSDVLPWFVHSERHESRGEPWHGRSGVLRVQRASEHDSTNEAILAGFSEIGVNLRDDFNDGEQVGAGYYDSIIHHGERWSAARAYLDPVKARTNLSIFTDALVRRVLFSKGRAVGVEARLGGAWRTITARSEVVLSAGAYHSPQLLQLSGVGDPTMLRQYEIPLVLERSGVGRGLQDHYVVPMAFRVRPGAFSYNAELTGWRLLRNLARFVNSRRGPMTIPAAQTGAFVASELEKARPDLQFHCLPITGDLEAAAVGGKGKLSSYPGVTLAPCVARPSSRGRVELSSPDPAEPPNIVHNYLVSDQDRLTTVRGMRLARRVAAAAAMQAVIDGEVAPGASASGDDDLLLFAKKFGSTGYHPAGTCRMGSDSEAVVDATLRVRGLEGLRVADASIMPSLISGNTHATCVMIGERAADFILRDN